MKVQFREREDGCTDALGVEPGMVFWGSVRPHETRGREIHKDTPRPWLVVSRRSLNDSLRAIVIAVPLTSNDSIEGATYLGTRIKLESTDYTCNPGATRALGSNGVSIVLTEQVRAISVDRLAGQPIAQVHAQAMRNIKAAIRYIFDL